MLYGQRRLKAWANWASAAIGSRFVLESATKIKIRIISTIKCYFWLYSPNSWEFRTICQLATCHDRGPYIGLDSADLSSFRALGSEDLQSHLTLEDRNL
ncbi:hypothetical protein TNCV_2332861 [Trichonephila clavipes]|nr:hypothetical protein TNCV_2332861 [Trichonephila clavipes]